MAVTGRVRDPALDELSGLVRSRTRPGLLWSHNDSGDAPVLYALRADGRLVGRVAVTGAAAVDWEDVAAAPGPEGRPFVYLGDIGDNDRRRATVDVYRVPEPRPGDGATAPAERLRLRYPDGAHDAETLLVDPRRGDLVIVTKAAGGARAYATSARRPVTDAVVTLRRGPRIVLALLTAGDVSADGSVVAVRGYGQVAAWPRRAGESLAAALRRPPCISPTGLLEGQGEALALDRRGTSFLTVAEGTPAVLRRYGPVPPG